MNKVTLIETHVTYCKSVVGYLQDAEWEEKIELDEDEADCLMILGSDWHSELHYVTWRYA